MRLGLVTISTQRLCGPESRSTFGPVTTASFSRDLALELHRAFTELDRSRSSRTVANAVTVKLIAVRSKLAANALKYPADRARGNAKKYSEL